MSDEKVLKAAVSAVLNYIREESLEAQKTGQKALWGISGRQAQMQSRAQVQQKAFYGWKQRY